MPPSSRAPWRTLAALFPPERFLLSPLTATLYASDAQPALATVPAAVAFPVTAEEVIALLRFCHDNGLPHIARGNGTGLCGGCCPPAPDCLVVSLQRLDRILAIHPRDRIAVVQPAVTPDQLDREARRYGLRYLPDPGGRRASTLGGNLAFDAAGPSAHAGGSTAAQLLGATLILPDGSAAEFPGLATAGALAADPLTLLSRSEGRLGIVVELTLALHPLPANRTLLAARFATLSAALEASDSLLVAGLLPSALELFDARTWAALTRAAAPGDAVLCCTLEGPAEETAEAASFALELLSRCGARRLEPIADLARIDEFQQGRDGLLASLGSVLIQDGVVPRSRLAATLQFLQDVEREESAPLSLFLDAATGNLFPCFHMEPGRPESFRRAERAALRFLLHCAESGGSISGRHGLGQEKRGLFASVLPEEETRFHRDLIAAFTNHPATAASPSVCLYPPLPGEAPIASR